MSIRRNLTLLILGAAGVLALLPGASFASSADVASTGAYVQANYALVLAAKAHLRVAENAPLQVLAGVQRECPGAANESPQNTESTQMSNEVIGAMVLTAYHLDLPAGAKFIRTVTALHWGNRRLASAVNGYASKLKTLWKLPIPNLCADVRAWVASGYKTLPASTVAFDAKFMPAWVAIGLLPHQLTAYEGPAQKSLAKRIQAIEVQLTDGEARAVEKWGKIMNELGLEP